MLLGDTHVREGVAARELQKAITQHLPSVQIKVVDPISNTQGGLVVMWDTQQWNYTHEREVEHGRIAIGRLERAGEPDGEKWYIFNVYMSVRVCGRVERQRDEAIWDKLSEAVSTYKEGSVIILLPPCSYIIAVARSVLTLAPEVLRTSKS